MRTEPFLIRTRTRRSIKLGLASALPQASYPVRAFIAIVPTVHANDRVRPSFVRRTRRDEFAGLERLDRVELDEED